MKQYIHNSWLKFKQDFLSKILYDVFKIPSITTLLLIVAILFPKGETLSFLHKRNNLTNIEILGLMVIAMTCASILTGLIFYNKYKLLQKDNFTDPLTGLRNDKALKVYLSQKIKEAYQSGKPLSIIIIDVDNFAVFNEKYNQTIGDKVLGEVGRLLSKDNRFTDETFRQYNRGDEFIIVSSNTTITEVEIAAERKRKFLAGANFLIGDISYNVTVCCGLSEYKMGDTEESLLERANYAVRNIAKKKMERTLRNMYLNVLNITYYVF
ncbi:hypothetical protein BWI96_10620 [Siphonobacter sp. SORGH_AS_0500]|uniref:GGDEF domain-containing protein n=1 Tax=Siphonobacter sp. SORGH_AS_0500 TaxID=1864824 RepID=UPI000CB1195A|nr:GGDEF domain-containing protein [Siphonobacter sp. SORGH_AS_0500]PKK36815.1 hypothetical protein BWI96_10620 [Siphonobacter sp. SORGH_AS_0500]